MPQSNSFCCSRLEKLQTFLAFDYLVCMQFIIATGNLFLYFSLPLCIRRFRDRNSVWEAQITCELKRRWDTSQLKLFLIEQGMTETDVLNVTLQFYVHVHI